MTQSLRTSEDAFRAGKQDPSGTNPFLWSSTLWEAFEVGQFCSTHLPAARFKGHRGSTVKTTEGGVRVTYRAKGEWQVKKVA